MFKRAILVLSAAASAALLFSCGNDEPTNVQRPPQISQQPQSVSVNVGERASFDVVASGNPAVSYQWRKDGVDIPGATQWVYVIDPVTAADAGVYTVVISNSKGSVTSSGGTLVVWVAPTITTQPVSATAVLGGPATFTVVATGNPTPTYQWRHGYADIPGATSSTLQINAATLADAGLYDVVVSNSAGPAVLSAVTLTVNEGATITTEPVSVTVNEGLMAAFVVNAAGTQPITYQWYKDGVLIPLANASVYGINPVASADSGNYTVIVTNSSGIDTSVAATLTVNVAPTITTDPLPAIIDEESPVTFTVTAAGTAPLHYQWRKNGVAITGDTNDSYTIAAVATTDAGNYTVVVSNIVGSVTSAAARLTVNQLIPVQVSPANGAANVSITPTFTWQAFPGADSYWVMVDLETGDFSAPICWLSSSTTSVIANAPALANATNHKWRVHALAGGNPIGNWSSDWSFTTQAAVAPAITTQPQGQSALVGDLVTFSVAASGSPAPDIQWQSSPDNSTWTDMPGEINVALTIAATITDSGMYYRAVATNTAGSVNSNAAQLIVTSSAIAPTITDPVDATVNDGDSVHFTVTASGSPSPAIQWQLSADGGSTWGDITGATAADLAFAATYAQNGGMFRAIASNSAGTATSNPATLTVNSVAVSITTQPLSATVTEGDSVIFSVVATGTAPITYQWQVGGVDIPGATSADLTINPVALTDAGDYTVIVDNAAATPVTSDIATLTVTPATPPTPVSITTQPLSATVTEGDSVIFSVVATGTAPITYQWQIGGVDIPGATSADLTINPVALTDAGDYTVVVDNAAATPVTSDIATLTVTPATPTPVSITTQPLTQTVSEGGSVTLSVVATGTAPITYQWQIGGVDIPGATSADLTINPVALTDAGDYTVVVDNAAATPVTSDIATLTVTPATPTPVSITTQPLTQTVSEGGSVTLSVVATGTAPITYQWQIGGVDIPGATSADLTINPVALTDAGDYTVVVDNAAATPVTSDIATLTVTPATPTPVSITTQPLTQTVSEGGSVTLSVVATGTAPITYQWQIGGVDIPGATSADLTINPVALTDAGDYTVVVDNAAATPVTSDIATLTVTPATPTPVSITTQPLTQTVSEGGSVTLSVVATGTAPITYQWQIGGVDIPGATSADLTINPVALTDAGDYTVVVDNAAATPVTSDIATLTVTPAGPTIITPPASQSIIDGDPVTFAVTASGTGTLTYLWQKDAVAITGETNDTYTIDTVTFADSGSYTVLVTDDNGSTLSAAAVLTVTPKTLAITTQPVDTTVVDGTPATLTVVATGSGTLHYDWQLNSTSIGAPDQNILTIPAVSAAETGDYSVVVTDEYGSLPVSSNTATLTLAVAPALTLDLTDQTLDTTGGNTSVTFSVVATGVPAPTYQWEINPGSGWIIWSETSPNLTIPDARTMGGYMFRCTATNMAGVVPSFEATLTVP